MSDSSGRSSNHGKCENLQTKLFNRQKDRDSHNFRGNLFRDRLKIAKNLYKYDLYSHYGCVNAIEFSKGGEFLISGGDDKRVLLWNVEKAIAGFDTPRSMTKEHQSNIFCLSFNMDNRRIFSGGNDELVIVHDTETGKVVDVYIHTKPVYGLSVDPTCDSIISTAGEDGRIILFDQRKSAAVMTLGKFRAPFHAVQFHPLDGNYLVTANSKKGASFWDIRKPHGPVIHYGGERNQQSCMSVRFNTNGNQVLALRQRLPPILYNTFSDKPICQFYHCDYYNSCTMKSCCFAGEDDEYVLSGSDDFNLYVWRVGDVNTDQTDQWIEKTHMVLYGHRSIVNQVRYNPEKCLLASSGVEKIVKLWSPFEQKGWLGSLTEKAAGPENPREVLAHHDYYSSTQMNWSNMNHDYSNQNTNEDPRMLAFFDSLIQQEIEGWNTDYITDSDCSELSSENSTRPSSTEDSDDDDNDDDEDGLINHFVQKKVKSLLEQRRRNTYNSTKPPRDKYTNQIAYLIAKKRNSLRRLALKGSKPSVKKKTSLKMNGKCKHNHGRRHGRYAATSRSRNGVNNKRLGLYTSLVNRYKGMRSLRRKIKNHRVYESPTNSSLDDDSTDTERVVPALMSQNIAVPSTSTGITSNSQDIVFRLRQQQDDSDDNSNTDSEGGQNQNRSISIQNPLQKIKLNGTNHTRKNSNTPNTVESEMERNRNSGDRNSNFSSDIDDEEQRSRNNPRKRRAPPTFDLDIYSSHSNSRLSNSSYLEDDQDSSNDESSDCFNKKRKLALPTNRETNNLFFNNNTNNNRSNNNANMNNNNNNNSISNVETGNNIGLITTPNNNLQNSNADGEERLKNVTENSTNNNTNNTSSIESFNNNNNNFEAAAGSSSSSISHNHHPHNSSSSNHINNNNNNNNINNNNNNNTIRNNTFSNNDEQPQSSRHDDSKFAIKLFEHKVARIRRNYRNKFGVKSDSD